MVCFVPVSTMCMYPRGIWVKSVGTNNKRQQSFEPCAWLFRHTVIMYLWKICWVTFRLICVVLSLTEIWTCMLYNISWCAVTGHLCGEFTGDLWIPRTKASGVEVLFSLICVWSKQSWGRWFETLSRPSWRHCNDILNTYCYSWKQTQQ